MSERRLVILAEGQFGFHTAKTAVGVMRFGSDPVVAVLDSTNAGRTAGEVLGMAGPRWDVPIVATLAEALTIDPRPTALLIGIAPTGGRLPPAWRAMILAALQARDAARAVTLAEEHNQSSIRHLRGSMTSSHDTRRLPLVRRATDAA